MGKNGKRNVDLLREARRENEKLRADLEAQRENVQCLKLECENLLTQLKRCSGERAPVLPDMSAKRVNDAQEAIRKAARASNLLALSVAKQFGDNGVLTVHLQDFTALETERVLSAQDKDGNLVLRVVKR